VDYELLSTVIEMRKQFEVDVDGRWLGLSDGIVPMDSGFRHAFSRTDLQVERV
jgi:hypothetical protein